VGEGGAHEVRDGRGIADLPPSASHASMLGTFPHALRGEGLLMRGSLDDPPIVIRQNRLKFFFISLVCGAFVLLAVPILRRHTDQAVALVVLAYVTIAFFGSGALLLLLVAIFPGSLIVEKEGIISKISFRTFRYRWADFEKFTVWSPATFSRHVGCIFSEEYQAHHASARITGGLGSFGGGWELKTADVVDLLNRARDLWGPKKEN
jgi:hypothetical protein